MCGIAGIVKRAGRICDDRDRFAVEQMISCLRHRGPDAAGIWDSENGHCIFGHARLSIIDISGSHQPMAAARCAMTYNGEIYNFTEMRNRLKAAGDVFHTNGDTEVVLKAFCRWETKALDFFEGMFAFAFWNNHSQQLFLARDPFGIKPLYYTLSDSALAFASELTALYAVPGVDLSIADDALMEYLLYGYVPSPKTILRGVRKLPPGHWLRYDLKTDSATIERYWQPDFEINNSMTQADAARTLDAALDQSVRSHLISDVPVGTFLSGGIDSSLVVSYAATHGNSKAFNAAFYEKEFDESRHAEAVARHTNVELIKCSVQLTESVKLLDTLARIYDEPFADSSALPTYLVCQAMREHVKVVLSGDGADEILGGYTRYQRLAEHIQQGRKNKLGNSMLRTLRGSVSLNTKLGRKIHYLSDSPAEFYQRHQQVFSAEFLMPALRDRGQTSPNYRLSLVEDLFLQQRGDHVDSITAAQLCDILTYLPEDNLTKVDRASMAHGLEVRVPFLSTRVWRVVKQLPLALRVQAGREGNKVALRALARQRLPQEIVSRPKKGFSIPAADWFQGALLSQFREVVGNSAIVHEYLRPSAIERLIHEHVNGIHRHHHRLWSLLMLALWRESHLSRAQNTMPRQESKAEISYPAPATTTFVKRESLSIIAP